jgi:hypothetical protein
LIRGQRVLRSDNLQEILDEMCRLVAATLATDLAKIVEIEGGSGTATLALALHRHGSLCPGAVNQSLNPGATGTFFSGRRPLPPLEADPPEVCILPDLCRCARMVWSSREQQTLGLKALNLARPHKPQGKHMAASCYATDVTIVY